MLKPNLLFLIVFINFLNLNAQDQFKPIILKQAKLVSEAIFNEDYENLINYTHPNVIEKVGGKEVMIEAVKTAMKGMKAEGMTIESMEIIDSVIVMQYENELHCLVPKIITMSIGDQKVVAKSYMFGFSDLKGEHWTFTEADKLRSTQGSLFFPDFKTNIEIPTRSTPIILEGLGEQTSNKVTIEISWERIEVSRRHEIETLLDSKLRARKLGYCFGGENGEQQRSYVDVFISASEENTNKVFDLLDQLFADSDLANYGTFVIKE